MDDSVIQYGPLCHSQDLENILSHVFNENTISYKRNPTPICVWGTHGLGKTEMVRDYALSRGWGFKYIAPAQFEEMGDLHGIPKEVKTVDGEITKYSPPEWVPKQEGPGILLLDDINRADDRILRGCMQLLQNYELASWKMPEKWQIIATANPEGSDYSVTPLDDAMVTRMIHFTYVFDHKVWAAWATKNGVDKRGISFVLTYPELINTKRTTPRSLTQFFELIKNIPDLKNNLDLVLALAQSTLDEVTASSFLNFVNDDLQQLIDPEEILDAVKFAPIEKKINSLSADSSGEKRVDRLSTITTRLYLFLTDGLYEPKDNHTENLIRFFLLDCLPKDLSMSLFMDLQKSSDEKIKSMLRDKRLATLLIDSM
ncbi:AAA family ATPase [Flavobacteriaceae bacterium]|nr:AAA family ATPase [Flavobacteriaceae bacterium]